MLWQIPTRKHIKCPICIYDSFRDGYSLHTVKFIGFLFEIIFCINTVMIIFAMSLRRRTDQRVDSFRLMLFKFVGLDIKCMPNEPFEMVLKRKTNL